MASPASGISDGQRGREAVGDRFPGWWVSPSPATAFRAWAIRDQRVFPDAARGDPEYDAQADGKGRHQRDIAESDALRHGAA